MLRSPSKSHSSIPLFGKIISILREAAIVFTPSRKSMPSTLGPDLPPSPLPGPYRPTGVTFNRSSSSASRAVPENVSVVSLSSTATRSTSSLSVPFDVDVVRVEGLRHAAVRLEARRYKTAPFAEQLLETLRILHVPSWTEPEIISDRITVQKVSGSLTNAVFFVSCPSISKTRTLLLRIYGPSSGSLISRPSELHTLHVLSSTYHIGPRVYGTFENGRVEEYFDSTALTANDLRDPETSSWIGARMAELHGVDIDAVVHGAQTGVKLGVKKNVESWLASAREVLALPATPAEVSKSLDLDRFEREWQQYTQWLHQKEKAIGASRRVFSHNDAQYGNLLRLRTLKAGQPAHRQIIVVDFEYSSPNPASFDIANHFHEWTANYHSPEPHVLDPSRYPTVAERQNFYRAYLMHAGCHLDTAAPVSASVESPAFSADALAAEMEKLEERVCAWSPASPAMWAVWGVVQAREFVEGKDGEPEFNYLGYAQCRMESFRREIRALGIPGLAVP